MTHATALRRIIRTARDDRDWPSGWWFVPAVVGGAAGWVALFWVLFS